MANEKMNVYIITKDKVTATTKDGKWFNQLFLPLFKSNKDPLKKQPKLEDYWNEIRNVLLSKKKNPNLKVIKHKDIKFISFKVSDSQVLAFAIGSEKSDSLEDIYNLTVKETKTTENNKQSTVATNNGKALTFELQIYAEDPEDFEDFSEYKKWEHHFDYLYGGNKGDYWDIEVEDHIESGGYIKVTGKIEGVDEYEFLDNIEDGMNEYGFDMDHLRSEFGDLEEEPVVASVENKEESFAEVEQDYKNENISYEEACDLLMELGVETHSDAQAMVDVWDIELGKM